MTEEFFTPNPSEIFSCANENDFELWNGGGILICYAE